MPPEHFFMTSVQRRCFWEWATKHWARGHRSAQSETWFFPSLHSVRCHVHHLPPQTHLSSIDLTQRAFQWKMFWIKRYISIAPLKSKSERYSFTLFYSVSILNFIQLKTPSVTLISLNLFLSQTHKPHNLSLVIDQWIKLFIEKTNGLKRTLTERWDSFSEIVVLQ